MLKADLHIHDPEVSWDSRATTRDMVRTYRSLGYDVVGFVGHDKIASAHHDEMIVLNGIERTISVVPEIHIVEYPSHGIKFLAHPRRINPADTKRRAMEIIDQYDLDAVEEFNGSHRQYVGTIAATEIANSDAHNPMQAGSTYTMIDADPDIESVIEAINDGRVRPEKGIRRPIGRATRYMQAITNPRGIAGYIRKARQTEYSKD